MLLLVGTIIAIVATVILFFSYRYSFWKRYGLPSPRPLPLVGNYADYILMRKNLGENVTDICNQFPDEPIIGTYFGTEPAVIVKDLELLKLVVTKDFYYFSSRELREHLHQEPFLRGVFSSEGDHWRVLRQNLTPLFSSCKMKNMFHLIQNQAATFEKLLAKDIKEKDVHEIKNFTTRYTMDCIGSCVFGVESKTLQSGPENPFRQVADKILDFGPVRLSQNIAHSIWPTIYYKLGFKLFGDDINNFFGQLIKKVFSDRNYKPGSRNDFIDLLLSLKESNYITGDEMKSMKIKDGTTAKVRLPVDDEMLVAQSIVFFGAGFETSASTMSFTLYELSKSPKALQRVLDEVDKHLEKHDGKITYDCVTDLPYLEACIEESLRLYPVMGGLTREVVEDYTLPSGVVLKKGVRVHIPVFYLHNHPDYFPNPEEFRPERFLGENKRNVKPFTYYPFGEGPRICIGMRFAKMQMMAGLVTLLKNYSLELPAHVPRRLEFTPNAFITQPKQSVELRFIPRRVLAA